ncbi:DUF2806 domain-containing protein [Pantoea agglomerans]|uniref:DUF2806 domain-containing protein n=1 Tax=Enterobacter agglomerans TaxID=549 RepID=UPI003BF50343
MDIKDLAGLSQPLTKLVEVISSGVGAVSKPYLIRKEAEARAAEIRLISDALNDVAVQSGLPVSYTKGEIEIWQRPEDGTLILSEVPSADRINSKADFVARKKQRNTENVTSYAARELNELNSVSEVPLDEDWITTFFSNIENVSSESMQQLWGRILAGEIKSPGAYSLRTLDFMRTLSQAEAETIEKVSHYVCSFQRVLFIPSFCKDWLRDEKGVGIRQFMDLNELGLLHQNDLNLKLFYDDEDPVNFIYLGDNLLEINRGSITDVTRVDARILSTLGVEVLSLLLPPSDLEILKRIGEYLKGKGAVVQIGKITEYNDDGTISYNVVESI